MPGAEVNFIAHQHRQRTGIGCGDQLVTFKVALFNTGQQITHRPGRHAHHMLVDIKPMPIHAARVR